MAFEPRTNCPSTSDKYWIVTSAGGYNKCILGSHIKSGLYKSVLPNCVGYAWGRFAEILGDASKCKLPTGHAGTWYSNKSDKYSRGSTPKVGAVICWSKPGEAGHVAIVEEVKSNGKIVTSESGYGNPWAKRFYIKERNNSNGNWGASSGYIFQGFIYNPNASTEPTKFSQFLSEAEKHIGEKASWTWTTYGVSGIEWCGAFVTAVAKTVGGLLSKVIVNTAWAQGHARDGVSKGYGKFYLGPGQGGKSTPKIGDLIFFRWSTEARTDKYDCDHVGIVIDVTDKEVKTIEGNTGTYDKNTSKVMKKSYSLNYGCISGYFRPDWDKVGGSSDYTSSSNSNSGSYAGFEWLPFYDSQTTREDATIREVSYVSTKYQPSIKSSDIKLSVINYTSVLSAFASLVMPEGVSYYSSSSSGDVDTSKLTGNCKITIDYFLDKGLNGAAACGIAGNISHESSFNTSAVGDNGTSFGICQWHAGRGTNMKQYVGTNWASNLSGQLDYLWYDLKHNYSSVLTTLKSVDNTVAGCEKAADTFVRKFEVPDNVDNKSVERQETAVSYFNKLIIQKDTNTGKACLTKSGSTTSTSKTVTIPSSVSQTGICKNYTNYTYEYSRWISGTVQRKLADLWGKAGKKSKRNIAVLDGYYLVAVTPKFGSVGDIITVQLADGSSFNAIIADSKDVDDLNCDEWGHLLAYGNGTAHDIIEWQSISTGNSGSKQINLGSWQGVKVTKIYNKGSYL